MSEEVSDIMVPSWHDLPTPLDENWPIEVAEDRQHELHIFHSEGCVNV